MQSIGTSEIKNKFENFVSTQKNKEFSNTL